MSFIQRLTKIQRKCSQGNDKYKAIQKQQEKNCLQNCRKLTEFQKHHSDLKNILQYLQCQKSVSLCVTPSKNRKQQSQKTQINKPKLEQLDKKQNKGNKILFKNSPQKILKLNINKLPQYPTYDQISKNSFLFKNLKNVKKSSKENPQSNQSTKKISFMEKKQSFQQKKGLPNIGNTCYMNAILQCLFHLKDFNEGFNYFYLQRNQIVKKYVNLYQSVMIKGIQKVDLSTLPLKRSVSKICSLFIDFHQQDAHQFLRKLLDSIHGQINRIKSPSQYRVLEPDTSKKNLSVLSHQYWNYYKKFDDSYIYDSLCGQICNYVTCANCKSESVGFDNFLDLSLPMVKGKNNLQQLLKLYFDMQILDDYYFCSKCKKSSKKSLKRSEIWKNPNFLIIQLKRSQFGRKNSQRIKIPVRCLNLKPYLTKVQKQARSSMYYLQGVVLHRGIIQGGHYWAEVKDNQTWYNLDDQKVEKLNKQQFINHYQNQGSQQVYILFYKCM